MWPCIIDSVKLLRFACSCLCLLARYTPHYYMQAKRRSIRAVSQVTVYVWNATIANLLLLALGSSAPNIMLVIIETATSLGTPANIIGPSSIVGACLRHLVPAPPQTTVPSLCRSALEFGAHAGTCRVSRVEATVTA